MVLVVLDGTLCQVTVPDGFILVPKRARVAESYVRRIFSHRYVMPKTQTPQKHKTMTHPYIRTLLFANELSWSRCQKESTVEVTFLCS
jgi:hypothetical protein